VNVTTLRGAVEAGHVGGAVDLGEGSWGSGKDWRVWAGEQVADLVDSGARVQKQLLDLVDAVLGPGLRRSSRRADLDQLARDALLTLASDWAFMVTKDSAAHYARNRAAGHLADFTVLARAVEAGRGADLAARQRATEGPFAQLDARLL